MGRPTAHSIRVATPSRVLDAALAEFAARGLEGARLADIAAAAGITRPSLLYHFANKEELYAATLQRAFSALSSMLLHAIDGAGPFPDRLRALVTGFIAFAEREPAVCRLLLRSIVADDEPYARHVVLAQAAPLLDAVTRFLSEDGAGHVRSDLPLRAALMNVVVNVLARAAAGPLQLALWGDREHHDTWAFVDNALLRSSSPTSATANPEER